MKMAGKNRGQQALRMGLSDGLPRCVFVAVSRPGSPDRPKLIFAAANFPF